MKSPRVVLRIIIDILMCVLILVLPWYVSVFLIFGCIVYFPVYLEALVFGFVFDTLYASSYSHHILYIPYTALSISTVCVLVVTFLRKYIRT